MTRTARPAHYVRHNAVTRIPRAHLYLDSEAYRAEVAGGEVQTFRLAVTAFDRKKRAGDDYHDREWADHTSTDSLWEWVTERCKPRGRTVLVAHNLAYDLRVCDAFGWFPAHGWELKAIRLADRQAWCTWASEGRTLVMVDTVSWVALPLEKIGELVHVPKLALPDWDDGDEAWFARCRRDVEILAETWRRIVGWLADDDLGNWKPTGAGQAWAAYRHRFMTEKLFVHEDDSARVVERAAAYTGRCECWRHGKLAGGPFTEWDYTNAYATIGAECLVPTKLLGELHRPTWAAIERASGSRAVLCEATVTTDTPTLPTRTDDGIVWPVGTFTGTWWDHELRMAHDEGARVSVSRAWWYRTTPALRAFCEWVLEHLERPAGDLDPVVRAVLKHWGRAIVGRTGAQWSTWVEYGRAPYRDVTLGKAFDRDVDDRFDLLQLGNQLIRSTAKADSPDAVVSIMSWVAAEARVRLWATMNAAGLDQLAYVDTDSLFVTPAGDRALLRARVPGLRVKSQWSNVELFGPRQLILSGRLRAAGIPSGAVHEQNGEWAADVWSGLPTSLRAGERDRVRIMRRRFRLYGTDHRRVHLDGDRTGPVCVEPFRGSVAS